MSDQTPESEGGARSGGPRAQERNGLIAVLVVVLGFLIVTRTGSGEDAPQPPQDVSRSAPMPTPTPVTVIYEVEGTVSAASLTLTTPDGVEEIESDVPMVAPNGQAGLSYVVDAGSSVSLSAQKTIGLGRGVITCRISVDGEVVSESTSTADFGIAMCDATA